MHHRLSALLLGLAAPAAAQLTPAFLIDSDLDRLYAVDITTGAATLIGPTGNRGLDTPAGLAWRADTRTLWTIDQVGGEVGTLNPVTGAFTHVFTAVPADGWQGIDFDPLSGMFWLVNQDLALYRLDPATGVTVRVGTTGRALLASLDSDAAGNLWGIGVADGVLYRIDKTTGVARAIVTTGPVNMQGLAFAPDGRLFATNTTTDSLYLVNPSTGATTLIGPHGGGVQSARGLEIRTPLTARAETSGDGCPRDALSWYELFGPGTFDLANGGLQMVPAGAGYAVQRGAGPFVPPVGQDLGLSDDSLSPRLALPFTFTFPGGVTNAIRVGSNGYVLLNPLDTRVIFDPTAAALLGLGPMLCPLWMDLDPSTAGSVRYDTEPTRVRVTWLDVAEFNSTTRCTVQVEINASGLVEYRWRNAGNAIRDCMVGFSPGTPSLDPGSRDLSTAMPFTTGPDALPLEQSAQDRPVLGRTINLRVTRISPGSLGGLELLGLPAPGGGIDLTPAGMPRCSLYVLPITDALPFGTASATAFIPLPIPVDTRLLGAHVPVQALVVTPGINAAGVVTSQLLTLVLGDA